MTNKKDRSGLDEMQIARRNQIGERMFMLTIGGILLSLALYNFIDGFDLAIAVLVVCGIALLLHTALQLKSGAFVQAKYRLMSKSRTVFYVVLLAVVLVFMALRFIIMPDRFPEHTFIDPIVGALLAICVMNLIRDVAARVNRRKGDD